MKKRVFAAGALAGLIVPAMLLSSALAADYSMMPTEELARMRGKMQDAPIEERQAFQNEWQRRVREMTAEEQRRYLGKPEWAESRERQETERREGFSGGQIRRELQREEGGSAPKGGGKKGR